MTKIEWLKLLYDKNLIWNSEAFTLTDEDKAEGITSVDEKIDTEYVGDFEENFAKVQEGNRLITIMKGQEGVDEYVRGILEYLESEELVNIIKNMSGGFKSVLEKVWNWKLEEDGEYTTNIATTTTASLNTSKIIRLADRLDKLGLSAEATELDRFLVAHCGHCHKEKKKIKEKKKAELLDYVKKLSPSSLAEATAPVEAPSTSFNVDQVTKIKNGLEELGYLVTEYPQRKKFTVKSKDSGAMFTILPDDHLVTVNEEIPSTGLSVEGFEIARKIGFEFRV